MRLNASEFMKLRQPRESPPGGLYYICSDGQRLTSPTDLRRLTQMVNDYYVANGIPVPEDIGQIIEDQICERLPSQYCWKGFGDFVSTAIQAGAGAIDKVLGTELQKTAKHCSSCANRRRKLNQITS